MRWFTAILNVLGQLVELRQYGRMLGVGFGILLMLVALLANNTALLLFGGVITVFAAFWPAKSTEQRD